MTNDQDAKKLLENADISELSGINSLFWSENNVKIMRGGKWCDFSISIPPRLYPFLKDLYYARGHGGYKKIVIQKGTQIGASEYAINSALYCISEFKTATLYMLPSQSMLKDFASARIDRVLDNSPNLASLFTDISNVGLKVAKTGSLYLRGSNSLAGLEEMPIGFLIRDEIDRMSQENSALATKRLGGSFLKWQLDLSHPISYGAGINAEYNNSNMSEWNFICPHCREQQTIDWFTNVDIEKKIFICKNCGKEITKKDLWNGFYVAREPDNPILGVIIPQLLSPTVSLEEQIAEYRQAEGVPYKMKLFSNTVLAAPYAEGGIQLSEPDIRRLMVGPPMALYGKDTSIGVDVGAGLHYWVFDGRTLIRVGQAGSWEDLSGVIDAYAPKFVAIDAGPESLSARTYAKKLRDVGITAYTCQRVGKLKGITRKIDETLFLITVEKTAQMDEFFSMFTTNDTEKQIVLPSDLPQEAIKHLCTPVRVVKQTNMGLVGEWEKGTESHYADAGCYAMEGIIAQESHTHFDPKIIPPPLKKESKWRKNFGASSFTSHPGF